MRKRSDIAQARALSVATGGSVFVTDGAGNPFWKRSKTASPEAALSPHSADPVGDVARLARLAAVEGLAEDRFTLPTGLLRLRVRRMAGGSLLWEVERLEDRRLMAEPRNVLRFHIDDCDRVTWVGHNLRAALEAAGQPDLRGALLEDIFAVDLRDGAPDLHDNATVEMLLPGRPQLVSVAVTDLPAPGRREVVATPIEAPHVLPDIEHIPVAMLELGRDGRILASNVQARRLFNLQDGEDPRLGEVFDGLGRPVSDWIGAAFAGTALDKPEIGRAARAKPDLFVKTTLSKVAGRTDRLIAVCQDATDMKTLEAQFVQSQKMQAIGQLAGGIAHDFNNLLTAISGHCDLLLMRHDAGDPDFADLVQINQNAGRAAGLVRQLLAFSRKQSLDPEVLELPSVLSDLTHLLNRLVGERVTLSVEHSNMTRAIRADPRQLEQVIVNLVVNARDAMPDGGKISIRTEALDLDAPLTRERATILAGSYCVISVSDEGTGIAQDVREKIFEPFFTTKRAGEGTGLGLSTVYGIVKQTGGYVFVDSTIGRGTTFTIYLPAADRPDPVQTTPKENETPPTPPITPGGDVVLLVEDEDPVRAFISRALRMRGHQVIEAADAEQALAILQDPELRVDVFLSDIIMPGRDGPSWVGEALSARPDTRVIFISGYAEETLDEQRRAFPASKFLPKPFSLAELEDAVAVPAN
ncbi:response regulator [Palleronia sediminis]|uniref:histidine kinase n=1 Tax=Palleronia sediminis TaxID=2547833 RepID=A0A4R6AKC8_9RHOB|nr:response regulator [Palleronia sediminis]